MRRDIDGAGVRYPDIEYPKRSTLDDATRDDALAYLMRRDERDIAIMLGLLPAGGDRA